MPWSVKKIDGQFCVVKEGETSAISGGCHDVRSEAAAHVRALYASEAEQAVSKLYSEEVDMEELSNEFGYGAGDNFEFSDSMKEHPWTGPIVFENVFTGDNRVFKADSINWQEDTLPWAFRWQKASGQGHAGSVPVGRVDRLERKEDGSIVGFGVIIPELSSEAAEYFKILKSGVGGGVSVDGDSAQFEIQEQEGSQPKVEFSSMRLRALSAVDIPAFNGARIHLIEDEAEEEPTEPLAVDGTEELADKKPFPFEKKDEDKDEDTDKDEDSEDEESEEDEDDKKDDEDKGKKKFPWDKEMSSMREELAKKKAKKNKKMSYGWSIDNALVAAAIPVLPSTDSFLDPEFTGPTALTVTPDGKVFGHLALFNTCHIGFPGTCVKPPKGSSYQYFHTGQIETAEGDLVDCGKLTFKTGHADMNASPRIAADHYDNTGTVAADVRAGEDKFGIWVVGALRPHLTDEDIRAFRCAPLSGDWRRIAGKLELVGALGVNTPGFPVPRVRAMVASGATETLFTFLEDTDEEFIVSDDELVNRLYKKAEFASKIDRFIGDESSETGSVEGHIEEDDYPTTLTKAQMQAAADELTKSDVYVYLKQVRDLLDDPDEKMPTKVRKGLEELYGSFVVVDKDGKKFSADGYDLDVIEASGLDYEDWEAELEFSGLVIEEFYNQCHGEGGRFCEGKDGPGRMRDNAVKGRHDVPGNPHEPGQAGRAAGDTSHRHTAPYTRTPPPGGGTPQNTNQPRPQNNNQQQPQNQQQGGGGGGVNPRTYENFRTARKNATRWAAAGILATAALSSPASGLLTGIATAAGVGILANPLTLGLVIATSGAYFVREVGAARRHRADYNRQVDRKLRVDRANQQADRIRQRAQNS